MWLVDRIVDINLSVKGVEGSEAIQAVVGQRSCYNGLEGHSLLAWDRLHQDCYVVGNF